MAMCVSTAQVGQAPEGGRPASCCLCAARLGPCAQPGFPSALSQMCFPVIKRSLSRTSNGIVGMTGHLYFNILNLNILKEQPSHEDRVNRE